MAIQLYRKGATHTVRGVECELGNFSLAESLQALSAGEGWVKDEQELVEQPVASEPEEPKKKPGRPKKEPE